MSCQINSLTVDARRRASIEASAAAYSQPIDMTGHLL